MRKIGARIRRKLLYQKNCGGDVSLTGTGLQLLIPAFSPPRRSSLCYKYVVIFLEVFGIIQVTFHLFRFEHTMASNSKVGYVRYVPYISQIILLSSYAPAHPFEDLAILA